MEYKELLFEVSGKIAVLTINRAGCIQCNEYEYKRGIIQCP